MQPLQALSQVVASGGAFDWRAAEAALYCLRYVFLLKKMLIVLFCFDDFTRSMYIYTATIGHVSVYTHVDTPPHTNHTNLPGPNNRAVHRIYPTPCDPLLVALFTSLPQLPPVPQLQYTACLMVGSYSGWLDASVRQGTDMNIVLELLKMLVAAFSHKDTASAATLALRNVCEACAGPLTQAMPLFGGLYAQVVGGGGGGQGMGLEEQDVHQVWGGSGGCCDCWGMGVLLLLYICVVASHCYCYVLHVY